MTGDLRHLVTLQKLVQTESEYGETIESWVDYMQVWAQVEGLRGKEFLLSRQMPGGEITSKITIRYRNDIDRTMRIKSENRIFEIIAILDKEGKRRFLEIMAREVN